MTSSDPKVEEIRTAHAMLLAVGFPDENTGYLLAKLDEAEKALIELKPDPVLVEGSWFPTNELPNILGNFIRSSAEYAHEVKEEIARREAAEERERALIAGVREIAGVVTTRSIVRETVVCVDTGLVTRILSRLLPSTPTEEGKK